MTNAAEVLADIDSGMHVPYIAFDAAMPYVNNMREAVEPVRDAVNPSHYKDGWSDDAELISISENLTSNGGQALQYVARSTRLDRSLIKGNPVEDLEKAIWFCQREIKRLGGS